jgi:predicted metal-binding protein
MTESVRARVTPWKNIILLCGKCARKREGGYGPKGKQTLKSNLREALQEAGHRRDTQIIETRCMGLCPKHATTMVAACRPGVMFAVPVGTPVEETLQLALGSQAEC